MKYILVLLSIMLLTVAGCGGSTQTVSDTPVDDSTPTKSTTKTVSSLTSIIAEVKDDTLSKNDPTENLVLPIVIKEASEGDYVVFGIAFNQVNRPAGDYFAKIEFLKARDKNNNPIDLDRDSVAAWAQPPVTEIISMDRGESGGFIPVVFMVGGSKPGVSPEPGSYQFEVQFFEKLEGNFDKEVDELKKTVNIKIG